MVKALILQEEFIMKGSIALKIKSLLSSNATKTLRQLSFKSKFLKTASNIIWISSTVWYIFFDLG